MEIIVLASGSPRRKELLAKTGLKFSVVVSGGEEKAETSDPAETVEKLSLDKASAVADLLQAEKEPQLIIGADTVVACDGEILGKPSDREDAFRMLWKLQGQTHQVYTGVTLLLKKKHTCRLIPSARRQMYSFILFPGKNCSPILKRESLWIKLAAMGSRADLESM